MRRTLLLALVPLLASPPVMTAAPALAHTPDQSPHSQPQPTRVSTA